MTRQLNAGTIRLYMRGSVEDSWEEVTQPWHLSDEPEHSADKVTDLRVSSPLYVYGPDRGYYFPEWKHNWVLLTYTAPTTDLPAHPNAGMESDIWYGQMVDYTIDEESRVVYWTARDVKSVLQRMTIGAPAYEEVPPLGTCQQRWWMTPNKDLSKPGTPTTGLRSLDTYDVDPASDNFREKGASPPGAGEAYVFGTDQPWNAWELLQFIVASSAPPQLSFQSALTFELDATPEAKAHLQNTEQEWPDLEGRSVWEAMMRILHGSGPLSVVGWWQSGQRGTVTLKIFSRDPAEAADWQTQHNLLQNEADPEVDPSRVQVRHQDPATAVRAHGELVKLQLTASAEGAHPVGLEEAALVPAWSDANQTDYEADKATADVNDLYPDVYRAFLLRWDETALTDVLGEPSTESESDVERGDRIVTPPEVMWDRCVGYPQMLRRTLLESTKTYVTQGSVDALSQSGDEGPREPLKAWYVPPDDDPDFDTPVRLGTGLDVVPLDDLWGIRLPDGYRGPEGEEPRLDSQPSAMSEPRWKHVVATVAVQVSHRPWVLVEDDPDTDYRNVQTLYVEGAEWWAACPGTIRYYDDAGNPQRVTGVLRNDVPLLEERAESALATQKAGLAHGTFHMKTVYPSEYGVGQFVQRWGRYAVGAPIMTVRHNLRKSKEWGSKLTTGEPWTRRSPV